MHRINHPLAVRPAERQSSRHAPSCRRFTLYGNALPEELIGELKPIQLQRLPRCGNGATERACYSDKLGTQNANGTTTMAYNLLGAMTSLTDPDQNQTVWTRDNLGRVIAEQNPFGGETFAYDANSNLVKNGTTRHPHSTAILVSLQLVGVLGVAPIKRNQSAAA